MREIVVVGGLYALFRPKPVPASEVATVLNLDATIARAGWVSERCGRYDHTFLADRSIPDDRRLVIFATDRKSVV